MAGSLVNRSFSIIRSVTDLTNFHSPVFGFYRNLEDESSEGVLTGPSVSNLRWDHRLAAEGDVWIFVAFADVKLPNSSRSISVVQPYFSSVEGAWHSVSFSQYFSCAESSWAGRVLWAVAEA